MAVRVSYAWDARPGPYGGSGFVVVDADVVGDSYLLLDAVQQAFERKMRREYGRRGGVRWRDPFGLSGHVGRLEVDGTGMCPKFAFEISYEDPA